MKKVISYVVWEQLNSCPSLSQITYEITVYCSTLKSIYYWICFHWLIFYINSLGCITVVSPPNAVVCLLVCFNLWWFRYWAGHIRVAKPTYRLVFASCCLFYTVYKTDEVIKQKSVHLISLPRFTNTSLFTMILSVSSHGSDVRIRYSQ